MGYGTNKKMINNFILNNNLKKAVKVIPFQTNPYKYLKQSDLLVLTSLYEGLPNVLLEAMSYGLPSISFDCDTGPRDMIQDGFNGVLINPEDRESGLIKALEKMITDTPFRKSIAENSILIRDKYSVESIMQKWNNVLDS